MKHTLKKLNRILENMKKKLGKNCPCPPSCTSTICRKTGKRMCSTFLGDERQILQNVLG